MLAMNLISYVKGALPTWWMLVSVRRSGQKIAVLSTVWPHHAKKSGYHPVATSLGPALPPYGMRLVPRGLSHRIVGEALDNAYQIALAMKVMGCTSLLVVDGDFQLK